MSEELNLKEIPSFIKEIEEGKFEITIKDKKFIMVEKEGKVIEDCIRLSENINVSFEALLARRSIVEPEMNDDDFEKLKGNAYMKLKIAVAYVYGLNDFF